MSNKKNEIRKGTKIPFADGVERMVYPISLRGLRKLMAVMKQMDEIQAAVVKEKAEKDEAVGLGDQMSDENIDLMVDAAKIILDYVDPEAAQTREDVEDLVDIRNFNELVAAAMGADPNGSLPQTAMA